jgi:hypothetical protein
VKEEDGVEDVAEEEVGEEVALVPVPTTADRWRGGG